MNPRNIKLCLTKSKGTWANRPNVPSIAIRKWEIAKPKVIVFNKFSFLFLNNMYKNAPGEINMTRDIPTISQVYVETQRCHGKNHTNSHPSKIVIL